MSRGEEDLREEYLKDAVGTVVSDENASGERGEEGGRGEWEDEWGRSMSDAELRLLGQRIDHKDINQKWRIRMVRFVVALILLWIFLAFGTVFVILDPFALFSAADVGDWVVVALVSSAVVITWALVGGGVKLLSGEEGKGGEEGEGKDVLERVARLVERVVRAARGGGG